MNIQQASDLYYIPLVIGMSESTKRKLGYHWKRWERLTASPSIESITLNTFNEFRRKCLAERMSPVSCETVITDVMTVLKICHREGVLRSLPNVGVRLRCPVGDREPAGLSAVGQVYANLQHARWPIGCSAIEWQTWLVAALTTGLRLSDLQRLEWSQIREDSLFVIARKTLKRQRLPLHPVLKQHLAKMKRRGGRVFSRFPLSCPNKIRRTLRELCGLVSVPVFTPQMIRRLAGREYERVHGGAGRILLGHGIGKSSSFYLSEFEILEDACLKMRLPDEFGYEAGDSREITDIYGLLSHEKKQALLTIARGLK